MRPTPDLPATTDNRPDLNRREWLKLMAGAAATMALSGGCATLPSKEAAGAAASNPLAEGKIQRAVAANTESFPPTSVRLLAGPFLQNQQRDEKYLLQLEPDRLLHQFRVNAGLSPKANVYGGWESAPTWTSIRCHGHSLGHYLSACSLMYASTGNPVYKQRVDYIADDLQACQVAGKDGLISAFPDHETQFNNFINGRRVTGVPWYTLHKVMAGLRDSYLYCGNQVALDVLVKVSDWAAAKTAGLTDAQFQQMLKVEHGGMNEILADVYVLTGDQKCLALAQRFCDHSVLDPLSQSNDALDKLHSNTQIPKFIGFQRLHQLTGQPVYQQAAEYFWQRVARQRAFATGGHGDNEHFFATNDFASHVGSAKTSETCCDYNMLKLTRALFEQAPNAAYADFYERVLYNCILASQDPGSGMVTYFKPLRPGYMKLYCTPFDSFWCCTGTGMENHAKYNDSIYFRSGTDTLYVNLFISSTLAWVENGLTIQQSTNFPESEKTVLKVTAAKPVAFTMNIRHPYWCEGASVMINGKSWPTTSTPGSYIALQRTWRDGDVVEVTLPMTLRAVMLPNTTDRVAFMYGPLVLAGRLGQQGIAPGADLIINERTYGDVLTDTIEVPTLAGDPAKMVSQIKKSGTDALTFVTSGLGQPHEVTLVPYHAIAHERYCMYWKVSAPPA